VKVALLLDYTSDFRTIADGLADLERAGLDQVWVPEPYGFDAFSQLGYLAARTRRVEIGTAIVNVFSRTPATIAMSAAGCDYLSDGRFNLGLGASGPQVVEGFHGVPFRSPLQRTREYIESCRMIWRREPYAFDGRTVQAPLRAPEGSGLGVPLKLVQHPVRPDIPIWWASLKAGSVAATAEVADGWLPTMFWPERAGEIWGVPLAAGRERRSPRLGPLQIAAGGQLCVGEEFAGTRRADALEPARVHTALYVGGMGPRGKNFYHDLFCSYGFESVARQVQDRFLGGDRRGAAGLVPDAWLSATNLVGPPGQVRERVAAYRAAGVTSLLVTLGAADQIGRLTQIERLRAIVDG
jgi:F420-dependent oxidoreductase-like protein